MTINDIGSNDMSALICNTNSTASNKELGDWFSPSGDKVGRITSDPNSVPGLFRKRVSGKLQLLRATTGSPPEGSYLSVMVYYSSYLSTKCTHLSCDREKTEYIMGRTKVPKFKHTELYHLDYRSKHQQ